MNLKSRLDVIREHLKRWIPNWQIHETMDKKGHFIYLVHDGICIDKEESLPEIIRRLSNLFTETAAFQNELSKNDKLNAKIKKLEIENQLLKELVGKEDESKI